MGLSSLTSIETKTVGYALCLAVVEEPYQLLYHFLS